MFYILDQDSLIPLPIESETFIQRQVVIHFFADMGRSLGTNVRTHARHSSRLQYFVFARRARVLRTLFTISNVLIEIIKTFLIAGPSSLEIAAIVSKLNSRA